MILLKNLTVIEHKARPFFLGGITGNSSVMQPSQQQTNVQALGFLNK
jgi:hypothetical protein